jgi:hypothetical protein
MTVEGCMSAEAACGQSLVKIAMRLSEGDLTINDIASVLTPAFRGGGNNLQATDVAKIIYEAGLAEGLRVCGEVLANVLNAGQDDVDGLEGEGKNAEPTLLDSQ